MASQKFNSFSSVLVALATIALFSAHVANANDPVNPFCKTSDYKPLCTKMVKGAKTWKEASNNAIQYTLDFAKHMQPMSRAILPVLSKLPKVTKDSLMGTCQENFDDAVYNLEESLNFLKQGDKGSLATYLSAVTFTDCQDELQNFGVTFPLAKTMADFTKEMSNTLAVVRQI